MTLRSFVVRLPVLTIFVMQDFESGSALVPFANFGSVTFTGASYTAGMY